MLYLPVIVSLFALVFAFFLIGRPEIKKNFSIIRERVVSYLKKQYKPIGLILVILFFILWLTLGFKAGLGLLVGGVASGLAAFMGMIISRDTAIRLSIAGLGLLTVSGFRILTQDLTALMALGVGASIITIFAKFSKRIQTKAALTANLFQTYLVILLAPMILSTVIFPQNPRIILFPLILASVGILASIMATFFNGVYKGLVISTLLAVIGFWLVVQNFNFGVRVYLAALIGLAIAWAMFITAKGRKLRALPIILISIGVLASFALAGIYGLTITALAMLSLIGIITFKNYVLASAGLAVLVLFLIFTQDIASSSKLLIGAMIIGIPYKL